MVYLPHQSVHFQVKIFGVILDSSLSLIYTLPSKYMSNQPYFTFSTASTRSKLSHSHREDNSLSASALPVSSLLRWQPERPFQVTVRSQHPPASPISLKLKAGSFKICVVQHYLVPASPAILISATLLLIHSHPANWLPWFWLKPLDRQPTQHSRHQIST